MLCSKLSISSKPSNQWEVVIHNVLSNSYSVIKDRLTSLMWSTPIELNIEIDVCLKQLNFFRRLFEEKKKKKRSISGKYVISSCIVCYHQVRMNEFMNFIPIIYTKCLNWTNVIVKSTVTPGWSLFWSHCVTILSIPFHPLSVPLYPSEFFSLQLLSNQMVWKCFCFAV